MNKIQDLEQEGGNITVYTGERGGKFIIKNGHKVYLDKKTLNGAKKYLKKTTKKAKK
jgi:hypothetical protein